MSASLGGRPLPIRLVFPDRNAGRSELAREARAGTWRASHASPRESLPPRPASSGFREGGHRSLPAIGPSFLATRRALAGGRLRPPRYITETAPRPSAVDESVLLPAAAAADHSYCGGKLPPPSSRGKPCARRSCEMPSPPIVHAPGRGCSAASISCALYLAGA